MRDNAQQIEAPVAPPRSSKETRLVVGLVNNMPDAAVKATERQFRALLATAAGGRTVELKLLSLPSVERAPTTVAEFMADYRDATQLEPGDVDGLIITGAEPKTDRLTDERYWSDFTRLIDWAERHTLSSIFSCLAAHGAALHLDGIERRPLGEKLLGLFDCGAAAAHPLLADTPERWLVPHSRFNGLAADDLEAKGYRLLTRAGRAGVDTFVREGDSLFVFFQGHLEYDARSLLGEYQRDILRFLRGETHYYPGAPEGYLESEASTAFAAIKKRALRGERGAQLVADLAGVVAATRISRSWGQPANLLYTNWLAHIAERKGERADHVKRQGCPPN